VWSNTVGGSELRAAKLRRPARVLCLDACGAPSGFVRDMSRGERWFCSELGTRDSGLALAVQVPSLMVQSISLWVCAVLGMVGANWGGLPLKHGRC
jgi:hypothetical protein